MVSTNPGPVARSSLALLGDRTFGPFFAGTLVLSIGVWLHNITAAVVVFRITGSAFMVGAVSVMQFAGPLLLSPWGGVLSDRVDRRRLLIGGQLVSTAGAALLAVWVLIAGVEGLPGPWPVLVGALLIGLGYAVIVPAMQSLVPALVPPEDLSQAIALNTLTFNIGRAAGPAIGAGVLLVFGAAGAFVISTACWLFSLASLLVIRAAPVEMAREGDRSVRAGLRFVREAPQVAVILVAVAALGFAMDPIITLTPPLAALLGGDDTLVGVLASAFGVGAVVTIVIVRRLRERTGLGRLGVLGLGLIGGGILATAFSPTAWVAVVFLFVAGAGVLFATTGLTTLLQQQTPDALRGRVMALWALAFMGSRPVAAAFNGLVADLVSTRVAFALAGVLALVAAVAAARALHVDPAAPPATAPDRLPDW